MNKDATIAFLRNVSKRTGIRYNEVQLNYFFEAFLCRLSESKYADRFYLKGGVLLSLLYGIESRRTTDIDFLIRHFKLDGSSIQEAIEEISSISIDDGIIFSIQSIKPIMKARKYPGIRVSIIGVLENIRQPIELDFAIGDPYEAKHYIGYRRMNGDVINLLSYDLEMQLAEKIYALHSNGLRNSRMKDFYDLYVGEKKSIDCSKLKEDLELVFSAKGTQWDANKTLELLKQIGDSGNMGNQWNRYASTYQFVGPIPFSEVISAIRAILLKTVDS